MPRTQLHSAASGPARTAFHAHRGVSVDELQVELAQANEVVTNKIEDARANLKADTSALKEDTNILKGDTNILKEDTSALKEDAEFLIDDTDAIRVKLQIGRPNVIGRAEFTPQQQTQVFECMRVLSQVESLTTDERQNATQKTRTLGRIRNDTQLQNSLNTLPEVLRERMRVVQNDFPSAPEDEARERLERFWMIQDLRRAIMAHFAAQSPAVPSSTTAANAPATQDIQP